MAAASTFRFVEDELAYREENTVDALDRLRFVVDELPAPAFEGIFDDSIPVLNDTWIRKIYKLSKIGNRINAREFTM